MSTINIRIIRHGKTGNAETDRQRQLNQEGRAQAMALGIRWKNEGFVPQVILCSAAPRAIETAICACGTPRHATVEARPFEELYFGTDPSWLPPIESAFKRLGNASLQQYLESEAADALKAWGKAAANVVLGHLQIPRRNSDLNVVVFTHALFGPMLFQAIEDELPRLEREGMFDLPCQFVCQDPMRECDVAEISFTIPNT